MISNRPQRIAVIGAGVAGITAAHLLQRNASVKLFEKKGRIGGHTNTVLLEDCPDVGVGIDAGFIVFNDRDYPHFYRLLADLNCPVRDCDMSVSFSSEQDGAYYTSKSSGLFSRLQILLHPSTRKLLDDIKQFRERTELGFFWEYHALLDENHCQTVIGGSHAYLKAFRRTFCGQIALNAAIKTVRRNDDLITIVHDDGYEEQFDKVIFASHADESLKLIESPTLEEQQFLGAWVYQENRTILHMDSSFMPRNRKAWASCNFRRRNPGDSFNSPVTYHMNRIQGLKLHDNFFVTHNPDREPANGTLVENITYYLPIFSPTAIAAQAPLQQLNGQNNTWFCGSYFGRGLHEDAVRSADQVAQDIGMSL